jgi:UDP-N-acetylglucosamine acyltransferase
MIHPTAVIESGAELGQNVQVGPFAYIADGSRIGDGCQIGAHASVLRHTTIGAACRIHDGAVIGDLPQDFAFEASTVSYVRIGTGCVIREGVTIHRGTKPDTVTEVGNQCFLMANSHLAHNVRLGNQVVVANGALLAGYVEVGDRCFISGNCAVHQFVRIGRLAMMGGGSAVSKDVPPFCTARPLSPNTILGLNVVGLRRAGFTPAQRAAVKEAFGLLYRSGLNVGQAVEKMKQRFADGPAKEMTDFVEASRRGICAIGAEVEDE